MGAVKAIGITTAIGGILGILLVMLLPLRPDEALGFLVVLTLGGAAIGVILSAVGALSYRMNSKTDNDEE
jgi:hypothetical protein